MPHSAGPDRGWRAALAVAASVGAPITSNTYSNNEKRNNNNNNNNNNHNNNNNNNSYTKWTIIQHNIV